VDVRAYLLERIPLVDAVLDAAGNLVQTLRPLSDTRPELALGGSYVDPGSGAPSRPPTL